jgi:hypothetical protein
LASGPRVQRYIQGPTKTAHEDQLGRGCPQRPVVHRGRAGSLALPRIPCRSLENGAGGRRRDRGELVPPQPSSPFGFTWGGGGLEPSRRHAQLSYEQAVECVHPTWSLPLSLPVAACQTEPHPGPERRHPTPPGLRPPDPRYARGPTEIANEDRLLGSCPQPRVAHSGRAASLALLRIPCLRLENGGQRQVHADHGLPIGEPALSGPHSGTALSPDKTHLKHVTVLTTGRG